MPNPVAIIELAKAKAELARLERERHQRLERKLDAILLELGEIKRRLPVPRA